MRILSLVLSAFVAPAWIVCTEAVGGGRRNPFKEFATMAALDVVSGRTFIRQGPGHSAQQEDSEEIRKLENNLIVADRNLVVTLNNLGIAKKGEEMATENLVEAAKSGKPVVKKAKTLKEARGTRGVEEEAVRNAKHKITELETRMSQLAPEKFKARMETRMDKEKFVEYANMNPASADATPIPAPHATSRDFAKPVNGDLGLSDQGGKMKFDGNRWVVAAGDDKLFTSDDIGMIARKAKNLFLGPSRQDLSSVHGLAGDAKRKSVETFHEALSASSGDDKWANKWFPVSAWDSRVVARRDVAAAAQVDSDLRKIRKYREEAPPLSRCPKLKPQGDLIFEGLLDKTTYYNVPSLVALNEAIGEMREKSDDDCVSDIEKEEAGLLNLYTSKLSNMLADKGSREYIPEDPEAHKRLMEELAQMTSDNW